MKKRFIFISLILFLIPIELIQAQRGDVHAIAILRVDGIIAPYAHYTNGEWESPEEFELERIARRQTDWHLHISPDSTLVLETGTPVIYDPRGQNRGHGMLSNYPVNSFGPNNRFPREKVGVVFNWDQKQAHFRTPREESETQEIREAMEWLLAKEEEKEVERLRDSWESADRDFASGIPVDRAARDSVEAGLRILRTGEKVGGSHIYYVSTFKGYRYEGICSTPILNGWLIEIDGSLEFIKMGFSIGDCDGKMLPPFVNPRVAFEHNGHTLIAADVNYYEGEDYYLFEVKDGEVSSVLKPFY